MLNARRPRTTYDCPGWWWPALLAALLGLSIIGCTSAKIADDVTHERFWTQPPYNCR